MHEWNQRSNKRLTTQKELQSKRIKYSSSALKKRPPPIIQHSIIEKILSECPASNESIKVSKAWYTQWEAYCLGNSNKIPTYLCLAQNNDPIEYMALPRSAVYRLREWYGTTQENVYLQLDIIKHKVPRIKRPAIRPRSVASTIYISDDSDNDNNNDATPTDNADNDKDSHHQPQANKQLTLKIYILDKPVGHYNHTFTLSADSTVSSFYSNLLNTLNNTYPFETNFKLWLLNQSNYGFIDRINNDPDLVLDASLLASSIQLAQMIDTLAIDINSTISSCLSQMASLSSNSSKGQTYYLGVEFLTRRSPEPFGLTKKTMPGLRGLQNLGNTCYMNSALQCLSSTSKLTSYFLSNDYRRDLNRSNALGLNGDLAENYATLLKDMWVTYPSFGTRRLSSISPMNFKCTFERFNKHFTGYQQQDSQEFLGFLLDGLHEDLNKVLVKPYQEIPDFDDHYSDKEIAERYWSYHKSRNNSIITDLFQGQYKSQLVCVECKKVSITFDPFMCMSLPLPKDKHEINIVYVPYSPSQNQLSIKLYLEDDAMIEQIKQEIEKDIKTTIPHDHSLLVVQISMQKISRVFKDSDPIWFINTTDTIYVYQLPCPSARLYGKDWIIFPVYCSTTVQTKGNVPSLKSQFGFPMVLAIGADKLKDTSNLYTTIASHIERYRMLKLYEKVKKLPLTPSVPNTLGTDATTLYGQQSIQTTAAVTPARDRPIKPMPNLFTIHIFRHKNSPDSFVYPLRENEESQLEWHGTDEPVKQGQSVLIEWNPSEAGQFFGTHSTNGDYMNTSKPWPCVYGQGGNNNNHQPSNQRSCTRHTRNINKGPCLITLQDCLNEFMSDEQLDNQDSWYCPRCQKHQRALKKMDIWRLPEIMIVHLKRFNHTRYWGNKVDTVIDFPIKELDMTNRVLGHPHTKSLIYDLYAVDNHYGGMAGGHYTAFAKNANDSTWYEFNDTYVNAISLEDIKSSAAYLLFYKRRESNSI